MANSSKMPLIGVTPLFDAAFDSCWMLNEYTRAIEESGGIPVVFSLGLDEEGSLQALERMDGVFFPGGQDVGPRHYGEEMLPTCGPTVPALDDLEIAMARRAFATQKPILAICRGMQMLNVALGGSLYPDIPTQLAGRPLLLHEQKGRVPVDYPIHTVALSEGSALHRIVGKTELHVNSLHHQSVKDAAPGLRVSSTATDGVIECVERKTGDAFCLGVQWHPEHLFKRDADARKIFAAFVEACRKG